MSCINASIIATRLRVAKNFKLLINAGIDSDVAAAIVSKHKTLAFSDVRIADDRVVIQFNTCSSKRTVDYTLVA